MTMNDDHIVSIAQLKELGKLTSKVHFISNNKKEKYEWVGRTLTKFRYFSLSKKERGVVQQYIREMTGLSRSQVNILIGRKKKTGRVYLKKRTQPKFSRRYNTEDVALLIKVDNAHDRLSGPATKKIFEDEYSIYMNKTYERIRNISSSHIYNLRETRQYSSHGTTVAKTQSVQRDIGIRKKPTPEGNPGYIRVDTVHQGDTEREKGVYHINLVDEVTQWEVVVATEKISEYYLRPVLVEALKQFPFVLHGFHSDNGGEFINKVVAKLLHKLNVEQTKSRSRKCNDNALIEGKNGSVIRKHMGRNYIHQKHAGRINQFYRTYFNAYLCFHRPCGYATKKTDKRGKIKKYYRQEDYKTPYQKFCLLQNPSQYLKGNITMTELEGTAFALSHTEAAEIMRDAKDNLFRSFKS